jgi:hypothetical protein
MDKKTHFLSHYSAAHIWQIPYIDTVFANLPTESKEEHLTYFRRSSRCFREGQIPHLCKVPLPSNAVVNNVVNSKVASPELTFIQLAAKLDFHRLVLLGLQLCSYPPGKPENAITSKLKLMNFTGEALGHTGRQKAMRALKYIEGGSASIMESLAYMILTLPNAWGGYGLAAPDFNHEIKLKSGSSKRLGQNQCFVDLYYKSAKVAVEYDSFAFHSSPYELGKDALRSAILERHGIEVMSLSTIQLYDVEACRDFAYNLADRIGKRIQIRTKRFGTEQTKLRRLLPLNKV